MNVWKPTSQRAKLVILHTHPIQYYAPLFRALASRGRIDIKVIYLTDSGAFPHSDPAFGRTVAWDIPLLDGYKYRVLQPETAITGRTFWERHDSKLTHVLRQEMPDWLLLYGYACRMSWLALSWARRHKVKVAYASDTNARLAGCSYRKPWKRLLLSWYFRRIEAFFSPSKANRDYLLAFGATSDRIHWCPFAIDYHRFDDAAADSSEQVDFVWAGKMVPLKRPFDFVDAIGELIRRGYDEVKGLMVGSGPLLEELRRLAGADLPCGTIRFTGFVNQSEIPNKLSSGRVFVFTSEGDQYGLAATEAAACGAALVVADVNGCVGPTSSAQPGLNCLTYPAGNVQALADCLECLLTQSSVLTKMRSASRVIAKSHDVTAAAEIIENVIAQPDA